VSSQARDQLCPKPNSRITSDRKAITHSHTTEFPSFSSTNLSYKNFMGYITHALWQNPYKEADGSKERQCLLLDERGMHLQHYAPKSGKKELW